MTDQLWTWSAADLTKAIGRREISSRETVESCLRRTLEVNPQINAIVDLLADEALDAADNADAAVVSGKALGPLHGVPVTIKINVDYAGRATTNGVAAFKDLIAKEDSIPVANLKKAGAVIFGRTNVPALSTRYFTDNALYGRTLNPWDSSRTPGGSSGGAAAAVAVGMGPIAHGNDRAGSVRYPAYACGVAGLRPSLGRIPDFNPSAVDRGICSQMTHMQGPLARRVGDLRLALAALAARDPRDPWWVPAPLENEAANERPRIAMFSSLPDVAVDPAVTAAVREAGRWLESEGYVVEEAAPPRFLEASASFWTLLMTEEVPLPDERAIAATSVARYGDDAAKRARASQRAYATQLDFPGYVETLGRRTTILREWNVFFEKYPVLLMPISWQLPVPIDTDQKGDEAMRLFLDAQHPLLSTAILGLPGLAVPTGIVDGIPLGVQLVSARFQESQLLSVGEVLETIASRPATPINPRRHNNLPPQ
jgi:amidase